MRQILYYNTVSWQTINGEASNEWSYTYIPPIRLHGVYTDDFTFACTQSDNLHRFTNSSLKSYMTNQLTCATRGQLTCITEALFHVPAFSIPTAADQRASLWEGLFSNPSTHQLKPD
jgi:hypothetical protein